MRSAIELAPGLCVLAPAGGRFYTAVHYKPKVTPVVNVDNNDALKRLEQIFLDTFADDSYTFSPAMSRDDVEEWNSLNQIRLLTAIEEEFGFQFDIEEIERISDVASLIEIISAKSTA